MCAWRHTWLYRVTGDRTVELLFDEGDPDLLSCRMAAIAQAAFGYLDGAIAAGLERLRDPFHGHRDAAAREVGKALALMPSPLPPGAWQRLAAVLEFQRLSAGVLPSFWPIDGKDSTDWHRNSAVYRDVLAELRAEEPCGSA